MTASAAELLAGMTSRDLPWRSRGVTAWQILVSEFMLQQTPVARVQPSGSTRVARWPTPSATAATRVADVLRAWGKPGSRGSAR
jgi:A/G-specific adenine glycosylase